MGNEGSGPPGLWPSPWPSGLCSVASLGTGPLSEESPPVLSCGFWHQPSAPPSFSPSDTRALAGS